MSFDQIETIADMLRWAALEFDQSSLFFGHGVDNSSDEALQLILYSLSIPYTADKSILQSPLTEAEKQKIFNLIQRRILERKPAPYLTKNANFAGLNFRITQDVLIPRSPLAELIQQQFYPWIDLENTKRVLELGTGSGCIAIAIAIEVPKVQVDAVDISSEALKIAKLNCELHQVTQQVQLIQSDLFDQLEKDKCYDLIISNPPYVDLEEYEKLPKEYRHEPKLALLADEEGLALVERILMEAKSHLSEKGVLIVEVGNKADRLMQIHPELPFLWLEFSRGGEGVFLLTGEQLHAAT